MLPVVRVSATTFSLEQPVVDGAQIRFRQLDEIPRGSGTRVTADPQVAALADAARKRLRGARRPSVSLVLPKGSVLARRVRLPIAVEENLREAVEFEFDRLTPLQVAQVYFDAVVVERDAAARQCEVLVVYAQRALVDELVDGFSAAGIDVQAVVGEGFETAAVDLLPEARKRAGNRTTLGTLLPIAVLLLLALAAIALPIWQKRELAKAIDREVAAAREQAEATDAVRKRAEELEGGYNFVLARKFAYPPTVQVVEELSRLFPDDTWLAQLDIRTTGRGKELQRDIQMRGDTANAGRLISILEGSTLITDAAPRSPTLKLQPGPGEAFDLGARVKPLAPPATVALSSAGATAASAAAATPANAATAATASASSPAAVASPTTAAPTGEAAK